MTKRWTAPALVLLLAVVTMSGCTRPEPSPQSVADPAAEATAAVDARRAERLRAWRYLGFGMFVHWGLYSELSGVWQGKPVTRGYSEQIQSFAGIPAEEYARIAERFDASRFDADAICALAKEAGARYVVVTTKHHDGFAMFETDSTDYDIVDRTPFARDPLKLVGEACRRQGLGLGLYFSLVDWHAGHAFDPDNNNPIPRAMEPLIERQLRELLTRYGPIVEFWFDMSTPTPEQSRRFAAIVRELQPMAAINGRIWNNQGDFVTLGDNQLPPATMQPPFEVPASIYHETWGYRSWQVREDAPGKVRELVRGLVAARAAGGNYLLNIGPGGDGAVVPFEAEVMRGVGAWLARHGSMLDQRPAGLPPQAWGSALVDDGGLSLYIAQWPPDGELRLSGLANDPVEVRVEDQDRTILRWRRDGLDVLVALPEASTDPVMTVLRVTLREPLRVIDDASTQVVPGATVVVEAARWRAGTSFAFGNGYRTQRDSVVSLTASVHGAPGTRFSVRLPGAMAQAGRDYRLDVGDAHHVVDGTALASTAIGPFELPAAGVGTLRITLAHPAYPAEDLGLAATDASIVAEPVP